MSLNILPVSQMQYYPTKIFKNLQDLLLIASFNHLIPSTYQRQLISTSSTSFQNFSEQITLLKFLSSAWPSGIARSVYFRRREFDYGCELTAYYAYHNTYIRVETRRAQTYFSVTFIIAYNLSLLI